MKTYSVRALRGADIDAVARLWRESTLSIDVEADFVPDLAEYRERLEAEWKRAWRVYVACDASGIAGFMAFEPEAFWLRQLFVDPARKGAGIGSSLLDVAKREMPEGFWLRTSVANGAARRFYEKHGLRNIGEFPHEHWPVTIVRYQWSRECL
ncbi:MAG: GNAT family N-acetyltransferase [Gluconacetobacter sp.]|uniref:GNAT family N-acetyltransferase n=1 Tax=Gluconacetobacter dulcium TaxID=2729096 RepID=A0A7W4JWJ0_9PROT|nr:GNAT family N-acetyltransferase [Gluconacetobacter dulcium]MBB2196024.1 GNAT family N-acetyltransferase [Gluconacetobacter dulcium]